MRITRLTAENVKIWIEQVDTSGKVGIVMEDGTVRIPTEESTA